jgi:serine/threonine-protein kinase
LIFASRYRILGLLGRGAMGEVYRADDLKLGQRVALKLLSKRHGNRSDSLDRFIAEVRLARTISHPNVCRVHDIGEAHGWHYLSMEYVDGETLESLLRRIGRFSAEKALDVARQLCAGLAAAHDRGVLHRDLKPSNIMIDGRGQVRILDLGLALQVGNVSHEIAGTLAYMAPEQLAGGAATERTDVYALGLVLYEIFTGERLFQARTFDERLRAADTSIPRTNAPAIDPAVDGTIRHCLERDPVDRPESALGVAAALPGGDALAAAFAAGRLPSPEMIASARNKGRLSLRIAWLLLLSILGGTVVEGCFVQRLTNVQPAFLPKPPEVLAEHAANILAAIGAGSAVDREFWFEPDLTSAAQRKPASGRSNDPFGAWFIYRQSPQYLVTQNSLHVISETDPPNDTPGAASVVLDPTGRLLRLSVNQDVVSRPMEQVPDWSALFAEAQLDWKAFSEIEPTIVPHDRWAWEGPSGPSAGRIRVAGATMGHRPVYFAVTRPEAPPAPRRTWFRRGRQPPFVEGMFLFFSIALFAAGSVLARRNLRLGHGDPRAAGKLAVFVVCGGVLYTTLRAHHVPDPFEEWIFLLIATGWSLVWAGFAWVTYMSLEPYMRRWWPLTLISWTRLLSGRVRDPLVGRDVLAGFLAGVVVVALLIARAEFARHTGFSVRPVDEVYSLEALTSVRHWLGALVFFTLDSLNTALGVVGSLLLVRLVVRNRWLSVAIWAIGIAVLNLREIPPSWLLVFPLAIGLVWSMVLLRLGLLSLTAMILFIELMTSMPIAISSAAWYVGSSLVTLFLLSAITLFGFTTALAGQSAFGEQN